MNEEWNKWTQHESFNELQRTRSMQTSQRSRKMVFV